MRQRADVVLYIYIVLLFYCFFLSIVDTKIGQLNLRYNFKKFQQME